jgi:hypothetical protein
LTDRQTNGCTYGHIIEQVAWKKPNLLLKNILENKNYLQKYKLTKLEGLNRETC